MTDSIPITINLNALFQLNRAPDNLIDSRSREEDDAGHISSAVLLGHACLNEEQASALGLFPGAVSLDWKRLPTRPDTINCLTKIHD